MSNHAYGSIAEVAERTKNHDANRRAIFEARTAPAPFTGTARVAGTPETGGVSILDRYEEQWAQEIIEATPSVLNRHTVEHLAAVKADVDRRRQELHAAANAIANRKPF